MSEYQKAERIPDVSLTPLYAGHGGAGPERALCLKAYLEDHPRSCPRWTLPGTTHTEILLCGAVQVGSESDRHFCLTQPHTHSILVLLRSYHMSGQTAATGGS
jgi:hypothetical protein